jgi:fatty acid synthase, animal type
VAGNAWRNIANSLALPTYMLQLMSTKNLFSIGDVTQAILPMVYEDVFNKEREHFYVVGYSFGAMIALELTKMLEKQGKRGNLVLIDGAPLFLKKLVVDQMPTSDTDQAVQSVLLSGILRVVFPEEKVDVFTIMKENPTWEERVEKIIDLAKDQYLYSTEYLRVMANCLFYRIKMVLDFKPDMRDVIKSSITLIRPTEISIVDVDEDYGLKKLTKGLVSVKYVEGNHLTMLENSKLVQIINELDPALESNRSFKKHMAITD